MSDLTEPMSADAEEQAVEAEDDDALLGEQSVVLQRIAAIRSAIMRVDEGRYGICLSCGGPITSARLEALPEAIHCIACAANNDR
jgi:DnaK suppressor protein